MTRIDDIIRRVLREAGVEHLEDRVRAVLSEGPRGIDMQAERRAAKVLAESARRRVKPRANP